MELLVVDPSEIRVGQVRESDAGGEPLALQLVARDQERWRRGKAQGQRLQQYEDLDARKDPVQRNDEQHDPRQVVPEVVVAAYGDERMMEPGEKPDGLVVDAQVEPGQRVAVDIPETPGGKESHIAEYCSGEQSTRDPGRGYLAGTAASRG